MKSTSPRTRNARLAADLCFADLGDSSDEDEADPLAEILADELALMLVRHL